MEKKQSPSPLSPRVAVVPLAAGCSTIRCGADSKEQPATYHKAMGANCCTNNTGSEKNDTDTKMNNTAVEMSNPDREMNDTAVEMNNTGVEMDDTDTYTEIRDDFETLLADWVSDLNETGTLLDAADQRLQLDFEEEEMKRLMTVGLCCAQRDPSHRLLLGHVIRVLEFHDPLPAVPTKIRRITNGGPPAAPFHRGKSNVELNSSREPPSSFSRSNSKVEGQSSGQLYHTASF
ncbi:hypothetical protein L1887_39969 [Cichorium endivia]|nr:hypothetical protein L1887_39969 [Cichorium endivia]